MHTPARIVINERTGTIVLGGDVKLTPVSVIHGNLSIQVVTTYTAAPVPLAPTYVNGAESGAGAQGQAAAERALRRPTRAGRADVAKPGGGCAPRSCRGIRAHSSPRPL